MSEENAERLAEALCRMRGAALKLGKEKEILIIFILILILRANAQSTRRRCATSSIS